MRDAFLSDLARRARAAGPPAGRTLVGIDGVDGAGKTMLADELAERLRRDGAEVVRLSLDGFHNPAAVRHRRGRGDPEGFYRDSYDYDTFVSVALRPLADGEAAYTPAVYDVANERGVERETRHAGDRAIVVVDGIFLHRDELAGYWHWSAWLDVPFVVSIPRGASRGPGFGSADPAAPSNRRYVEGQRLYLAECAPQRRATVVVDNTDLERPRIVG